MACHTPAIFAQTPNCDLTFLTITPRTGFIKIARNYNGCSFHTYVGYATVTQYGRDNGGSDRATDYDAGEEDSNNDCEDNFTGN